MEGTVKKILNIFLVTIFLIILFGCSSSHKSLIYNEPSIDLRKLDIHRIAIVPNRLPLNLTDPEKWRRYNWEVAKEYLVYHGFDVIDYHTSVAAFNESGLPLEDTKSSRDKYADLAQKLSVDAILIPYYGTQASMSSAFLVSKMNWTAVATFQVYSAEMNDFITRLDMTGNKGYTSGIFTALGFGLMFVDPSVGSLTLLGGTIFDMLFTVFKSQESHFKEAFKLAIAKGLDPFIYTFSKNKENTYKKLSSNHTRSYDLGPSIKVDHLEESSKMKNNFGIQFGVNLYKSEIMISNFELGFHGGVFYQYYISTSNFLQTEILYKRIRSNGHTFADFKFFDNLIEFNLLFNQNLNKNFFILFGPTISYSLGGTIKYNELNAYGDVYTYTYSFNNADRPTYGASGGLLYQFNKFSINVRYYLNFGGDFSEINSKNIILLLGYKF